MDLCDSDMPDFGAGRDFETVGDFRQAWETNRNRFMEVYPGTGPVAPRRLPGELPWAAREFDSVTDV
jgi:hypothetical protein